MYTAAAGRVDEAETALDGLGSERTWLDGWPGPHAATAVAINAAKAVFNAE